jgi:anaerobic magnesium-protoporphyrin IX monomethyl ester cyclase
MNKLRILLINPPRVDGYPVVREERFEHKDIGSVYPPLSLLYMASALEKAGEYEVKLIDANGFDLTINRVRAEIIKYTPDVVITRCGFDTQKQDMEVVKIAKDLGAITVLRNKIIADCAWIRDGILKEGVVDVFIDSEPDAVVAGLAEAVKKFKEAQTSEQKPGACLFDPDCKTKDSWDFLETVPGISYYLDGSVKTNKPAQECVDLDALPYPAWHLLPSLDVYHTGVMRAPFALVQTTRGCPFKCTFCAYGKSTYRARSIENVVDEIKMLKDKFKIKSFLFFDDTISLKKGRTEELAQKMIDEKLDTLEWVCCTRANLVSKEMLSVMKKAGMKEIAIGIETGSQEIQNSINKGVTLDDIRQAAKWCKELGILFYGLAIIGLPGESRKTVEETIKFMKEIDPFYTQFCFATPFPNTDIYKYYKENGYLLSEEWSKYFPLAEEPVIRTKELSAEGLKEMRRFAYKKMLLRPLYLLKKIRPFDWKWNIEGFVKIAKRIWNVMTNKAVR